MKAYIAVTAIGCFALDEKNSVLDFVEFPKDPKEIAERLSEAKTGRIAEQKQLEDRLAFKGYDDFEKRDADVLRAALPKLAAKYGFARDQMEFNRLMGKVNIELAKAQVRKAAGRDNIIMQVNGAIEEMDKAINILVERLREWYGLHFPEMSRAVSGNDAYADIVSRFGSREKIAHPDLGVIKNKSMGMEFRPADAAMVQAFASQVIALYRQRKSLEDYLDEMLKETAPNLRDIAGPALAAKIIALAGGMEKLVRMPSSTIQLLGAEKALFRHLHGRGKSPKHGIVIIHPLVQNAMLKDKGKLSRLVASKMSIAAKMDFYSKVYRGKDLKNDLEDKAKKIIQKK
jgi:nucleolar protein 56